MPVNKHRKPPVVVNSHFHAQTLMQRNKYPSCLAFSILLGLSMPIGSAMADAIGGNWYIFDENNDCLPATSGGSTYAGACELGDNRQANQQDVRLNNEAYIGEVVGGIAIGSHTQASGNQLVIDNSKNIDFTAGGFALNEAKANNNTVIVNNNSKLMFLIGGALLSGEANNNSIEINGQSYVETVIGGLVLNENTNANDAEPQQARQAQTGGVLSRLGVLQQNINQASGSAINNKITLNQSRVITAMGGATHDGPVSGNTVNLYDSHALGVMGGNSILGNVTNNHVRVHNSLIDYDITGGRSVDGQASNNIVHISGTSEVNGWVYGGISATGEASNNRIVVSGNPVLENALLTGGVSTQGPSYNNSLELHGKNFLAYNVEGFQHYEFHLPATISHNDSVLTLRDPLGSDLGQAQISGSLPDGTSLRAGDRVILIRNSYGLDATGITASGKVNENAFVNRAIQIAHDDHSLYAQFGDQQASEQSKAPLEARVGAVALLSQNTLHSQWGIEHAQTVANGGNVGVFGGISGGHTRYKTGSHVDVNGVNLLIGLAKGFDSANAQTTLGGFIEGGHGKHRTHNWFNSGKVVGKGKSRYFGVGLLARHEWGSESATPYLEGSLRTGRLHSDWRSNDLINTSDDTKYDTSSSYFGVHLAAGYRLTLNKRNALDLSAKYFWTRVAGDNVTIDGANFHLKSVKSSVGQLAATFTHSFNQQYTGFIGLALEREFNGKARATVNDLSAPAPSLKGNTGVLNAGIQVKPSAKSPFSARLGLRASTGKQRGVSGVFNANYRF